MHDYGRGLAGKDSAVFGHNLNGLVTVGAIAIDLYLFAGEHLADRQALQRSLGIPFPLAFHLYLIRGGDVGEGVNHEDASGWVA